MPDTSAPLPVTAPTPAGPLRTFNVRCDAYGPFRIQATTASKARYQVFKLGREAGYFRGRRGFRDFLDRGWIAVELR